MQTRTSPFDKTVPYDFGTPFADLTIPGKWIFIAKVIVCVGTFGYVFPNVQNG